MLGNSSSALSITARDWGWRYSGTPRWAARDIDFSISPGERVLLLGKSGAGKSTLLSALAGLLSGADEGEEAGSLLVNGRHPTRMRGHIGLVTQDPSSQVILQRVGDDAAFGCENMAMPREQIWPRVRNALDTVGLNLSLNHPTSELSGGQQQRLVIAGALAMHSDTSPNHLQAPGLLCLDEPTANLDPDGIAQVHDAVATVVANRATTLLIVEHRVGIWLDLVDRVIVLGDSGGVIADGKPTDIFAKKGDALADAGVWVPGHPLGLTPRVVPSSPSDVLAAHNLVIGHAQTHPVQQIASLTIPQGLSTTISGPNGTGKTTLALTLAGLLPPLSGHIEATQNLRPNSGKRSLFSHHKFDAANPSTWQSRDLLTRIGTVFQNPEHQFVTSHVREELAVGLRALGRTQAEITAKVDDLLARLHLEDAADANPFSLSGGQKRRLSVGTVLATTPAVIILDEPTFGQDRRTWIDLVELVQSVLSEGRTVLSVTHDDDYIKLLGENMIQLESLRPDKSVAEASA